METCFGADKKRREIMGASPNHAAPAANHPMIWLCHDLTYGHDLALP
jgi:hypothetical protein